MESALKVYDAAAVYQSFAGRVLFGFADGDFVSIEPSGDYFSTQVGVGGSVTRVKNQDRTAVVTITTTQGSKVNEVLSAILASDDAAKNGAGVGAYELRDGTGTTVVRSPQAWIMGPPTVSFASGEPKGREWKIALAKARFFVGSNIEAVGGA